jgi:hypothetical protein
MAFYNYIRRKFEQDIACNEFERHPNFMPQDFSRNVVSRSQIYRGNMISHMDCVRDRIASSLKGEL